MRLLKGMMACMAVLFFLGYVNSCDTGEDTKISSTVPQENSTTKMPL